MTNAKNQLICPIILRQTISYAIMWNSRSGAEPNITLNKHKASLPFGASALYFGSEEDGRPQTISSHFLSVRASSIALLVILPQVMPARLGSHPRDLHCRGGAHRPAERACCQWADPVRDQPLGRRGEV